MIVSPTWKFIFVHVPKNAGTTIESLLMEHLDPAADLHISEAAEIDDNREVLGTRGRARLKKHITAPRLRNALPKGHYDLMFSFAFSRNPYSRCYSAYSYITARAEADARQLRKNPAAASKQDRSKFTGISFDEVCADLDGIAEKHGLFRPQTFWLPDIDSVDYVGRLENLSQDLALIYTRLGLPTEKLDALPVANMKSARGAWRGMAPASAAAIRKFYASDFQRFGYDQDFEADDGAPARTPVAREGIRVGATRRNRWGQPAETQPPARAPRPARDGEPQDRPRSGPRPPKPLRTRAERQTS